MRKQREFIVVPPPNGWKEHTVYLVEVQHFRNNPKHKALLHVGFLDEEGNPGGYSEIWQNSYDSPTEYSDNYSIHVLQELCELV